MQKVIFLMISLLLKIFKTLKEFLFKLVRKSKLLKSLKLKSTKLLNYIDQLPPEVPWSISCYLTCQKFTPSINIHFNHLLMLSIELLIKLLKDLTIKKKCLKSIKMEMPLYHKSKKERNKRRKLNSFNKPNNKLNKSLLNNKRNKELKDNL